MSRGRTNSLGGRLCHLAVPRGSYEFNSAFEAVDGGIFMALNVRELVTQPSTSLEAVENEANGCLFTVNCRVAGNLHFSA